MAKEETLQTQAPTTTTTTETNGGGYLRDTLEQSHILRVIAEFKIADYRSIRRAAECSVFVFVDFFEKS